MSDSLAYELDRAHVFHSWSAQGSLNPFVIAGAKGVEVWDEAGTRYLDGSKEKLTYFARFIADVRDRTATAMPQEHVFEVTRLALEAQRVANEKRAKMK